MRNYNNNRRRFIKKLGASAAGLAGVPAIAAQQSPHAFQILKKKNRIAANERINIATIGVGGMGFGDTHAALSCGEGAELIATCDCYDDRLIHSKEVFGQSVKTTRDYKEVLDNKDIDAVIIATPDHWHKTIAIEALRKGKAVYCEKPIVQHIPEGHELIKAYNESNLPFQVGSQFVSSLTYEKAKELYQAGEIGKFNFAEAYFDRHSAIGAWQYSIPPNLEREAIAWEQFLGDAPDRPFDAKRFFRWRNYQDYGTGIPGDLFVHLFSMLHFITGSHGPERVMATGGLRYWDDERDVADVMLGMFDYAETQNHPAFNFSLRVNFADGSGGRSGIRMVGSEGEMELDWDAVTVRRRKLPKAPGMSIGSFSEATQKEFKEWYQKEYANLRPEMHEPKEMTYRVPEAYGYDGMRQDHFDNLFQAMRKGEKATVEDPVFGLRAAGPALAANISHYEKKMVHWDPENMDIKAT
ncbi:putative dehydrogenase [Catalinimonas alkaloidigena]|uniref:Gfo/Idh/MocA family protein n=1 Tax=Catalinimonas alkaloidigena TaxID=1075417 RepID=UPI0024060999|nr:Gfo/Idh/MocA family oxidoreductase [Catalinimonas alkaloidigena]MDF9798124.1 putative dehydrogenase [Catalinimonas alkaloidigena]